MSQSRLTTVIEKKREGKGELVRGELQLERMKSAEDGNDRGGNLCLWAVEIRALERRGYQAFDFRDYSCT